MAGRSAHLPTRATRLFLRSLAPAPQDAVVELASDDPRLTATVARQVPGGHLTVLTYDATLACDLERSLQETRMANTTVVVAPGTGMLPTAQYDLAYLIVRPFLSHAQVDDLVRGAQRILRPGG